MTNQKSLFKSIEGRDAVWRSYNQLLAKCEVPLEEIRMDTQYGETYVIASGDPALPALILLHGSGSNASMWVGDMAQYAKHYRVYAVDIPGDPGKSEAKQYSLKSDVYAEWMDEVRRALHLESASWIGISLGAWLATQYAIKYPDRVNHLVLLAPSGIGPQRISFLFRAMPLILLGEAGRDRMARLVQGNQPISSTAVEHVKLIARHYHYRSGPVPIFTDHQLQRLSMPIMLIVGAKDVMLDSNKTVERLSRLRPNANVTLLPEVGHVIINQTSRILSFLDISELK